MKEKIEEIMENFDFEKVHKTMVSLNWVWYSKNNNYKIPYIFELQNQAYEMLVKVSTLPNHTISTGGFKASSVDDKLALAFYVDVYVVNLLDGDE